MPTVDERARSMLADELEAAGYSATAREIRNGDVTPAYRPSLAALTTVINQLDEARAALAIFAAVADEYDDGEDDCHAVWTDMGSLIDRSAFHLRHYRAARAALNIKPAAPSGEE